MTDNEIIEMLARSVCIAAGINPDKFPAGSGPYGYYGHPRPSYAPDGIQRPWHEHVEQARRFFCFHRAMQMVESVS